MWSHKHKYQTKSLYHSNDSWTIAVPELPLVSLVENSSYTNATKKTFARGQRLCFVASGVMVL